MIVSLLLLASAPAHGCADAQTQIDMNVCSYQEYQAADRAMNAAWQRAVASAKSADKGETSGGFNRLLNAQRKWLAYRDAECLAEVGPREESGSIWPLEQNSCLRDLTKLRVKQLADFTGAGRG